MEEFSIYFNGGYYDIPAANEQEAEEKFWELVQAYPQDFIQIEAIQSHKKFFSYEIFYTDDESNGEFEIVEVYARDKKEARTRFWEVVQDYPELFAANVEIDHMALKEE